MKKDPYKLRAVALLIAIGFVGGMFVQYQAPGTYVLASHKAKKQKGQAAGNGDAFMGAEEAGPADASKEAPAEAAADQQKREEEEAKKAEADKKAEEAEKNAAEAEKPKLLPPQEVMPATLRGAAALGAVVDNTLEITGPKGEKRFLYFASRGVVAESDGAGLEARLWSRDDDRLCRSLGGDKRECFYLAVRLNDQLRKGALSALPDRISALEEGEPMGSVEGVGAPNVQLLRGNVLGFPGYVPLLEGKPAAEWTRDPVADGRSFVGALLVRQRRDADRAATFFAPNGQVFEASRLARHTVSLWIGAWRRQGDLVCRELKSDTEQAPRAEECARARITDNRIEFVDAGPSWRSFLRSPWPDDEPDTAGPSAREPASPTGEVVLGARGRKTNAGSFTDLR
jgi:hypothetical protein